MTAGDTHNYTTEESYFNYGKRTNKTSNFLNAIRRYFCLNRRTPRRGIEPRSPVLQAGILTTILPRTHILNFNSPTERTLPFSNAIKHIFVSKYRNSPAGSGIPVSRVTAGDTHNYTTEDSYFKFEVAHRNNTSIFLNAIRRYFYQNRKTLRRGIEPRSPA